MKTKLIPESWMLLGKVQAGDTETLDAVYRMKQLLERLDPRRRVQINESTADGATVFNVWTYAVEATSTLSLVPKVDA